SYSYERPGRRHGDVHRFRLALTDFEALRRADEYLKDRGIVTQEFVFQEAVGAQRSLRAIRSSARAAVASIQELVLWPRAATDEWCRGFLAGIFDAEGSYSRGILRISNTDAAILDQIEVCLRRFGFPLTREVRRQAKPVTYVRLTGGVVQHLRFFHTVDPAITRKRSIEWQAIKNKARLRVVSIEPLKTRVPLYDITTGTGDFIADGVVSHNCFARSTHTYLDLGPGRDFETKIFVKVNAPELLPKELRAKKWKGEHIAMGTATDPYQRAEGKYRIMPRIVSTLTEFRNPFSILTKGTLILRDLDLLTEAAKAMDVSTAFSIGTLDEDAWSKSEPGTPHPRKRMDAVRRLNEAGIPCGVMLAPILPGITDDPRQMREVIKAAFDAGATHVSPILLHLRPYVKEVYIRWLEDNYPDLVPMYMSMYDRRSYARQSDRDKLTDTVNTIKKSLPRPKARYPTGFRWRPDDSESEPNSARSEQLSLI
ncbi:MAG: radical SAM protein, partial [Actinomycetota bacterium]